MTQVLVVDDSGAFRGVVCAWIKAQSGLEFVAAVVNGREAVDEKLLARVDLVLMDAVMPEMDGFEATRRIKRDPHAPRVVILTLHDSPATRRAAEDAGADGFVAKSELVRTLPGLLTSLIDGRKDLE